MPLISNIHEIAQMECNGVLHSAMYLYNKILERLQLPKLEYIILRWRIYNPKIINGNASQKSPGLHILVVFIVANVKQGFVLGDLK